MSSCLKKNAVRQKSVQIRRAIFAQQKSESLNPNGKNHFNLCNLWEKNYIAHTLKLISLPILE